MYRLVRDRIPDIIRGKNDTAACRRAQPSEVFSLLGEKTVQEAKKIRRMLPAKSFNRNALISELADLHEVLDEIMERFGIAYGEVVHAQGKKRSERGGFKELWLVKG